MEGTRFGAKDLEAQQTDEFTEWKREWCDHRTNKEHHNSYLDLGMSPRP